MIRSNLSRQKGMSTVEFAIVGAAFFMVLFAIIEFGRFMFVLNLLDESTRRGARLAAVCPVTDQLAIRQSASFNGVMVADLTEDNIQLNYLRDNGSDILDPVAGFGEISYVRASIINYQHNLLIPFINLTLPTPDFATTIPGESLGVHPTGAGNPDCGGAP